ncbi:MAG: glycosyltransferase family 2 protein [Verrucomicrobiia bacterium]
MTNFLPKISVIIPIYGRIGDYVRLVEKLKSQTLPPHEIILVDSSPQPLDKAPEGTILVKNPTDIALSWDYNLGAKNASGDFILNMQQDCLPESNTAIEALYKEMTPDRVAVVGTVSLPKELWEKYDFWGEILMARWVGEVKQGISGKFDLIRRDVFMKIGGYDTRNFCFAGEDMDLYMRLSEQGEVYVSDVRVLHLHNQTRATKWKEVFTKSYQLAESFGALFRKWGFKLRRAVYAQHLAHHLMKYFYPLILLLPFRPIETGAAIFIISNLANWHVWRVRSPKVIIMLVFNPLIFFTCAAGTLMGFITGKQKFSLHK